MSSRQGRDTTEANPVGRPRIKLDDLDPRRREIMFGIYEDGGSDTEVKVALAIKPSGAMSNGLFDDLCERELEFSQAVNEGRMLAEA